MTPECLRHFAQQIRDPQLARDLAGVVLTDAAHRHDETDWSPMRGAASTHDERDGDPDLFEVADELEDRADELEHRFEVDEDEDTAWLDALRAGAI